VDSSSATGTQRFNRLAYYIGGGHTKTVGGKEFAKRPPQEFIDATLRVGFTMREIKGLANKDAWQGSAKAPNPSGTKGLASFVNFVHAVYRAWDIERNVGTQVYHAAAADWDLRNWFEAHNFLEQRGIR